MFWLCLSERCLHRAPRLSTGVLKVSYLVCLLLEVVFYLNVENPSKPPGSKSPKVPSHSCAFEGSEVNAPLNQQILNEKL